MDFTFQDFCEQQELTAELLADASYKLNVYADRLSLPADKKRLPMDRLEMKGSLQINSNTAICLPEIVKVGGDLTLVGVGIKSLPRVLEVGGTLVLRSTSVVEIHSGCTVGHLMVSGTPLRRMPIDWVVPGDVRFERCDFLVLPDGLSVGSLRLAGCKVSELPSRLRVRDELDISGSFVSEIPVDCQCGGLTARDSGLVRLPENWRLKGALDLSGSAMRFLSKGLHVSLLDISGTRIEEIPDDCEIGTLKACHSCLTYLPENWKVDGDLNLSGCRFLSELPKGLWVQHSLSICETGVKEIPIDCHVGNLDATKSALKKLPDNWTVEGDVDLFGCESMTELPQGLKVGGRLVIMRTNITRIPSGCRYHSLNAKESRLIDLGGHNKLDGSLMLGLSKIKRLPERLVVGGDLGLDGLRLDKLPDYLRVGGTMSCEFASVDIFSNDGVVAGCVDCRGCHLRLVPEGFIAANTTSLKAEENRMYVFTRNGLEFHPNGNYCRYKDEVWRVDERGKDFVRLKKLMSEDEIVLKKGKFGRYKVSHRFVSFYGVALPSLR